jgi:hypothetical protein
MMHRGRGQYRKLINDGIALGSDVVDVVVVLMLEAQ